MRGKPACEKGRANYSKLNGSTEPRLRVTRRKGSRLYFLRGGCQRTFIAEVGFFPVSCHCPTFRHPFFKLEMFPHRNVFDLDFPKPTACGTFINQNDGHESRLANVFRIACRCVALATFDDSWRFWGVVPGVA